MQCSNEIKKLSSQRTVWIVRFFPGTSSKEIPIFCCKTVGAEPLHLPFTPLKRCPNTRKNYSGGVFNGIVGFCVPLCSRDTCVLAGGLDQSSLHQNTFVLVLLVPAQFEHGVKVEELAR